VVADTSGKAKMALPVLWYQWQWQGNVPLL